MDSRREYQEGWNRVKLGLMEEASEKQKASTEDENNSGPIEKKTRPDAVELWQGDEIKDVMSMVSSSIITYAIINIEK